MKRKAGEGGFEKPPGFGSWLSALFSGLFCIHVAPAKERSAAITCMNTARLRKQHGGWSRNARQVATPSPVGLFQAGNRNCLNLSGYMLKATKYTVRGEFYADASETIVK